MINELNFVLTRPTNLFVIDYKTTSFSSDLWSEGVSIKEFGDVVLGLDVLDLSLTFFGKKVGGLGFLSVVRRCFVTVEIWLWREKGKGERGVWGEEKWK
uniref:Uncharacterized protein n=1 Tax=Tanacetum cinerariifolium TaxID=118510 RepID=A0A699GRV0_TANCI|nr:hypothetical protein [Tanacetum cinerariifolium]